MQLVLSPRNLGKTALFLAFCSCAAQHGEQIVYVSPSPDGGVPICSSQGLEDIPIVPRSRLSEQLMRDIDINAWPGAPRYFAPYPWPGGNYKPFGNIVEY